MNGFGAPVKDRYFESRVDGEDSSHGDNTGLRFLSIDEE